ncbi:ABC transporter permease [Roseixanthobacter glucoisosaccharinicivorans]|uniref:ABC transporter permease n=1 Tax=Roseixanthobacter glucoisosaccharinicivorans TaxID=3119923 RepID=UPI00372BD8D5
MSRVMESVNAQLAQPARPHRDPRFGETTRVRLYQLALLALFLGLWEGLTRVPYLIKNTFLDPFFISRPSLIAEQLWSWTFGAQAGFLFPHLASTLGATLLGLAVAGVTGFAAGLILSQNPILARTLNPFIVCCNSLPRIAMVPLITMMFGLGLVAKVVTVWFVVFFLIFFNTFKGSLSVEAHILQFCRTLGASPRQILWNVRVPSALAWTFAALPNAISFSLVGVVIAEFVGTTTGMGYLIVSSLSTLNASEMFAAITVLGLSGICLVTLAERVERRLLRWSPQFNER